MKDVTVALKDLTSRLAWQHVRQLENPNSWVLRGASLGSYSNQGRLCLLFPRLSDWEGRPQEGSRRGPALPAPVLVCYASVSSSWPSNRKSCRSLGNVTPSPTSSLLWLSTVTGVLLPAYGCTQGLPGQTPCPSLVPRRQPLPQAL